MLDIKNNMMAENAARHLGQSYDALSQSVERLSSGLRINSAADDAAGMAVSEMCRSTVASSNKARVTRRTRSPCCRRQKVRWDRTTTSSSA